jgi:pimeloyl-ACP methyl ester carboxylesterase
MRLTALRLPLLALYGIRDRLETTSSFQDFASVPAARLVRIPHSGHSPMVEKPYATSRLILSFARNVSR